MLENFLTYIEAVIGAWFTGYWFLTALPEALSYVVPSASPEKLMARLDQWTSYETRQYFYRCLFIVGIFVAGFLAWDEQYQIAISKSPETLVAKVTALQSQLAAVRDEIWISLNAKESADLTSSFKAANISGLKVSVVRSDTPDSARVANQIVVSLLAAGAIVPEPPFHTFDGEGSDMKVFADPTAQPKGPAIQTILSKAFGVPVEVVKSKQPWTANGKSIDLGIMIGLRVGP